MSIIVLTAKEGYLYASMEGINIDRTKEQS